MTDRILHDVDGAGRWVDVDFATQADIADLVEGPTGDNWRMEVAVSSVNVPNTGPQAGGLLTVTVSGLAVGDLCFWLATDSTADRFEYHTRNPVCSVATETSLAYTNGGTATVDPGAADHYFLVIHLS